MLTRSRRIQIRVRVLIAIHTPQIILIRSKIRTDGVKNLQDQTSVRETWYRRRDLSIDPPESSSKRTDLKFWPVPGHTRINQADKPREGKGEFGTRRNTSRGVSTHTGVDIEAPTGAKVVATADGVAVNMQPNPSSTYGKQVVIKHGDGTYSQYAHLNQISVTPGSPVNGGEQIGTVGRTGNTPPLGDSHLHHERRIGSPAPRAGGGTVVDPIPYLP